MSLIHNALKTTDTRQQPGLVSRMSTTSTAPAGSAWLQGVLAFVIVVGMGAAAWWVWQEMPSSLLSSSRPEADGATATSALPQVDINAPAVKEGTGKATEAVMASAEGSRATVGSGMAQGAGTAATDAATESEKSASAVLSVDQAATNPAPGGTKSNVSIEQHSSPHVRQARPAKQAATVVERSDGSKVAASGAVADDSPVKAVYARFVVAMRAGDMTAAQRALDGLKTRLPASSIGLLRAQAWFDLRTGNDAAAAELYRTILDRVPGDEEAAVNLASIQSRQQKYEEARTTLNAAAQLNPESVALQTALAQYTPNVRK